MLRLPLEEWLFFIIIPFCCIFLYEVVNSYFKKDTIGKAAYYINSALIICFLIIALTSPTRLYTVVNFATAASILFFIQLKEPSWLGLFYRGFLFCLIPFLIVNGILTGLPIVTYDPSENLGLRVATIPVEDFVYCLSMLIVNIGLYEYFKDKDQVKSP
jgi:lycopene cyclase domain-containing protein